MVNDVSGGKVFGSPDNEAVVLDRDGGATGVPRGSKAALAHVIWDRGRVQVADALRRSGAAGYRDPDQQPRRTDTTRTGRHVTGRLFTSESVTEGHPDKIADQISDTVLDEMLRQDPKSRVAVETLLTTGLVVVAGEVTTSGYVDVKQVVRDRILEIGYDSLRQGLRRPLLRRHGRHRRPVRRHRPGRRRRLRAPRRVLGRRARPAGRRRPGPDVRLRLRRHPASSCRCRSSIAQRLAERLSEVRQDGTLPYLRPDGKTQVTIEYDDEDRPVRVDTVVVSTQHAGDIDLDTC